MILASSSPRRRQLLALVVDPFQVQPAGVDENLLPHEMPRDYVLRLAEEKARAVAECVDERSLVIAADTTVVDDDEILGKPADSSEAAQTLRRLRNRTHQVLTGLAVFRRFDDYLVSEAVVTQVPMRNYSDREIEQYIASGDPFDKAGAYGIQNERFDPAPNLGGCFANVMGFPICHFSRLLEKFGVVISTYPPVVCQQALTYACPVYKTALAGNGAG